MPEGRSRCDPATAVLAQRGVEHAALTVAFPQGDHARQGARPIRTGTGTADDVDALQALGGDLGPDHPAAEGIVERDAVEGHQGPARAGRRDGAQADPLGGRIGPEAGGAPEQRNGRHGRQGLVQPRRTIEPRAVEPDHREGRVSGRRRQAGRGDDNILELAGSVLDHAIPLIRGPPPAAT